MSDTFRAGIVQVQAYQVGTGFIVSVPTVNAFFIVTCVHVLGQPPLAATAKVVFYPSAEAREIIVDPARCYVDSDVAFLPLPGPLPEGTQPLLLGSSQGTQGHSIQAFGFPALNGYVEGIWGRGSIDGPVNSLSGNKLLQLSSVQITQGFSGSAIWDEYSERVVGVVTAIQDGPDKFGKGGNTVYAIPTETLRELLPDLKLADICPYRGLQPFREQDAAYFFGRERYIEELLDCLKRDKRLLAILGPIGSGKTSVVQAGLIPQLRKNGLSRSERWHIEILPASQDPDDPCSCAAFFGSGERLVEGASQWYRDHAVHERLVLIFDHFEHIFTPAYDPLRQAFLDEFVKLIESNLITVILIMRDDYYSLLAEHTALIKLVEQHLCNIPAMTGKNILSVIEKPAAATGVRFEGRLSSFIAADAMRSTIEPITARLKRHSSILPSLSVCLLELWERRVDNELMLEEYQSLGGVFGALPQRANEIYSTLTEAQQRLARRIFTDLVSPGDEQAGRFESRVRKTLSELCHHESERSSVREIVERFAQAGLLETNLDDLHQDVFVQILHEIVLREWGLLQSWLRDDHQFMNWYHDIQIRAQQWIASSPTLRDRDQDLLLRGRTLMIASEWLDERAADIHTDVQTFIRESNLFCEQEQQRKKHIEEVQQQGRVALAKQLATQAQLVEMQEPRHIQRSLLLAVEALKRYPCLQADQAVRRGLNLLPLYLFRLTRSSPIHLITFGADGSTLVAADHYHILWTHAVSQVSHFKEYLLPEPNSIALSSDGYSLVVAGKDHCAWLVDAVQGRPLLCFPHTQRMRAVALSHHHPYRVATASDDMTVGIWDGPDSLQFSTQHREKTTEAHLRYSLKHAGVIHCLAFSPDDQYLATACADNKARVWDVGSGALLAILEHQRPLHLLAFSPDGKFVACSDDAYTAVVWQWEQQWSQQRWGKKEVIRKRQCLHRGVIRALTFSPDGSCLLTVGDDATARIWDIRQENEIQEIKYFQHLGPITAACFHPSGRYIATASEDHTARIWEVNSGQVVHYLPHEGPVTGVAFHPMKPYIVTGSADGELVVWETGRGSQMTCFEHEGKVRDFFIGTYRSKYHLSLAFEEQNGLHLMDFVEGDHTPITVFQGASSPSLTFAPDGRRFVFYDATAIAFSPDGRCVATAHEDGVVKVWDTRREYPPVRLSCNGRVHALTFSADGQYLAGACYDGSAFVWEWKSGAREAVVQLSHPDTISAVTFTPDGTSLVTTCEDHLVRLWKWKENSQRQMLDLRHQNRVHQAIVSPTGKYLLTVSQEQGARIWDSTTGSLVSYKTHRNTVLTATFSPDGAYVATASSDGTVGIWETATERQLASLEHQGGVYACKFSADGKYLATASDNHLVCVWIWRSEDLIREANFHLTRNLTEEEWRLYIGNEPYQRTCLYLGWRETPLKPPFPLED